MSLVYDAFGCLRWHHCNNLAEELKAGLDPNHCYYDQTKCVAYRLVHQAAWADCVPCLSLLINAGAVLYPVRLNVSILDHALRNGSRNVAYFLIDRGFLISPSDKFAHFPLTMRLYQRALSRCRSAQQAVERCIRIGGLARLLRDVIPLIMQCIWDTRHDGMWPEPVE